MGQSHSKIKPIEDLKSPDRKKQKKSTGDDNDRNISRSGEETSTSSLASRLETVRDGVYTNGDLFNHISSFMTVQDLISFAVTNQETEKAVKKFLSHWKCSVGDCPFNVFKECLDFHDSELPATCAFCKNHFCQQCCSKCSDSGVVSCFGCCFVTWCFGHEVYHCEACNFTFFCDYCGGAYCKDSEMLTLVCDACERGICTNCTRFFYCNSCNEKFCRDCAISDDFDQCEACDEAYCAECSPGTFLTRFCGKFCEVCQEK